MTKTQLIGTISMWGVLLAGGLLHGWASDRWTGHADELRQVADRLQQVPERFGGWESVPEPTHDSDQFARAGVESYILRRYVRSRDGLSFVVLAVVGRPGPISVHTPDVCYRSAGYDLDQPARKKSLPGLGWFWVADFVQRRAPIPAHLTIYWAWSTDGGWVAPNVPRVAFARKPALLKFYLLQDRDTFAKNSAEQAEEFLLEFLPVLARSVFGAGPPT